MFDLFTGKVQHVPSTPAIPILVSSTIQGTALAVIAVMSFVVASRELPPVPDMFAFIAEMPAVAPPPPPPPPVQTARAAQPTPPPANAFAAPIEAPLEIQPEPIGVAIAEAGVPGGVEGGIVGGIVGSVPALVEGPPPPPPAPVPQGPVRIGGQVSAPALVKRVEPVYPVIAQAASIDGVVILDAIVDDHGRIQSLKVLRGHPLLAKAAIDAVQQWEYEPLKLNGTPTPFELTVSLWFHFDEKPKGRS
jgi:periplasmic protein TonB